MSTPLLSVESEAQAEAGRLLDAIMALLVQLSRGMPRRETKAAIRERAAAIVALGFGIVERNPVDALAAGAGLALAPRHTLRHDGPAWLLTPDPEPPSRPQPPQPRASRPAGAVQLELLP